MSRLSIVYYVVAAAAIVAALVASPSLGASAETWRRVQHDALRGGGYVVYIRDVVPAEAGAPWLAVGFIVDSAGARTPSAWTSPDGQTWKRSTMGATGAPEPRDGAYHVARRGPVAVAVGARFDGRVRPAAWRSVDGTTWAALTDPADPLVSYEGSIEVVEAGPAGFVAVGVEHATSVSVATFFRSVDGSRWEVDNRFITPSGEGFEPHGLVVTDGVSVVVGDTATAAPDGRIWFRRGIGPWERVAPEGIGLSGPDWQQVATVVRTVSGGYLAGGLTMRSGIEVPTLWSSPDGIEWTMLPEGTLPVGDGGAVHELEPVGGGFAAAGSSGSGPKVWRSASGVTWTAVTTPARANPGGGSVRIAVTGNVSVLLDARDTGSTLYRSSQPGVWKRVDTGPAFPAAGVAVSLVDAASSGSRVVAVGNDRRGGPLVMLSQNAGGSWRSVAFRDPAARFQAVTANGGVFAIAGWRLIGGRAHLAWWTSTTGVQWKRLGGSRGDPIGAFVDIAADGKRFLSIALQASARGLVTAAWTGDRSRWSSSVELGLGEARSLCVGPGRATAVAVSGADAGSRILAWRRSARGVWPKEPELVSSAAAASRCADGPAGTVVVGDDRATGAAAGWRWSPTRRTWQPFVIGATAPRTTVDDIVRDGKGFLASGSSGARGQSDLALWRSPDGVRWARYGGLDRIFAEAGYQVGLGVTKARSRLVIVGRQGAGDAGLWVGT